MNKTLTMLVVTGILAVAFIFCGIGLCIQRSKDINMFIENVTENVDAETRIKVSKLYFKGDPENSFNRCLKWTEAADKNEAGSVFSNEDARVRFCLNRLIDGY